MRVDSSGHILIKVKELVPGVIVKGTFDSLVHRQNLTTTSRGCRGREVEVVYDTMPERYKAKVCEVLGDPLVLLGLVPKEVERPSINDMTPEELMVAHARYNIVTECRNYAVKHSSTLGVTKAKLEFAEMMASGYLCQDFKAITGEVSDKTIARWDKMLRDGGGKIEVLAPVRIAKEGGSLTADQKRILIDLYCNENKPKIASVYRMAIKIWRTQGVTTMPHPSMCRRYIDGWSAAHVDIVTYRREGHKALKDKCLPYLERDPASLDFMDCWVADGKVLNFQIAHPDTGKPCRATMIGWMDMRTLRMMGFELMVTENTMSVASALRNACVNAGRLVGGGATVPRSIYIDNGKAFKNQFFNGAKTDLKKDLDGLFTRLQEYGLEHIQYSRPYNARSKTIERVWQQFDEFEKVVYSYVGDGLNNKPASLKRNEVWHRGNREALIAKNGLPTLWGAYQAIDAWVGEYNSRTGEGKYLDGASPAELSESLASREGFRYNTLAANELSYLMMHSKTLKLGRNGFKINGISYYNRLFSSVVGNGEEYIIKYSPNNPEMILVFRESGQLWCTAEQYWGAKVHAMAALGSEADRAKVAQVNRIQQSIEDGIVNKARLIGTSGADYSDIPSDNGVTIETLTLPNPRALQPAVEEVDKLRYF